MTNSTSPTTPAKTAVDQPIVVPAAVVEPTAKTEVHGPAHKPDAATVAAK